MLKSIDSVMRRDDTVNRRVERLFSRTEIAHLLNIKPETLDRHLKDDPDFPAGTKGGRERRFSIEELMKIRALLSSTPRARKNHLLWRAPDDPSPIPVVCFSSLKGGSGKSITASHFAQYLSLHYGMRVGIMDTDPQATATVYYSNQQLEAFDRTEHTIASFMGVGDQNPEAPTVVSADELDTLWQETPWPGIRIIPGGSDIFLGDLNLYNMQRKGQPRLEFLLKDAIERWSTKFCPKTRPADMRKRDGRFNDERFKDALNETVDIIVIDQQPALTLIQMNGIMAASNLAVVIGARGFDLNSLSTYVDSVNSVIEAHMDADPNLEIGPGNHTVIVTNVDDANSTDREQFAELFERAPLDILPVYAIHSVAVPNAAKEYKSNYEWIPDSSSKKRAQERFLKYCNAVNDALFRTIFPDEEGRNYQEIVEADLYEDEPADAQEQAA
ncbi:ParA family protein [Roseivivax sp. CAU 1761]